MLVVSILSAVAVPAYNSYIERAENVNSEIDSMAAKLAAQKAALFGNNSATGNGPTNTPNTTSGNSNDDFLNSPNPYINGNDNGGGNVLANLYEAAASTVEEVVEQVQEQKQEQQQEQVAQNESSENDNESDDSDSSASHRVASETQSQTRENSEHISLSGFENCGVSSPCQYDGSDLKFVIEKRRGVDKDDISVTLASLSSDLTSIGYENKVKDKDDGFEITVKKIKTDNLDAGSQFTVEIEVASRTESFSAAYNFEIPQDTSDSNGKALGLTDDYGAGNNSDADTSSNNGRGKKS